MGPASKQGPREAPPREGSKVVNGNRQRSKAAGLALLAMTTLAAACGDDPTPAPSATPTAIPTATPTATAAPLPATWVDGIDAIFETRCLGCHAWAASYEGVADEIQHSIVRSQVYYGHQIWGAEQQAVLAWIDVGYPYDADSTPWPTTTPTPPPTPSPTPTQPTETGSPPPTPAALRWSTGIDAIFDDTCVQCHSWARTYEGVVGQIESGALVPKVQGGHHISGQDRDDVLAWVTAGYPE